MKKFLCLFTAIIIAGAGLAGCGGAGNSIADRYQKITPEIALEMMEDDAVILDVRTREEFDVLHIKGAVLLPDFEIKQKAEEVLPDKNQIILVYCRSGNRSETAAKELISMGYKKVFDFGGIVNWHGEVEGE